MKKENSFRYSFFYKLEFECCKGVFSIWFLTDFSISATRMNLPNLY